MKERIVVLNLNSNRKSVSHGFLAGIFGTLERFGVVVDLNNTSEVHVSMAIEDGGEEADGAPAEGAAEERDVELLAAVEYPAVGHRAPRHGDWWRSTCAT
jgi:aspartokinase